MPQSSSKLYRLYGLLIRSPLPLKAPAETSGKPDIQILPGKISFFNRIRPFSSKHEQVFYAPLTKGSFYIRFFDLYEFWISPNGRSVLFLKLASVSRPKFAFRLPYNFLQTNVLSFCLLKFGFETIHGSAIAIDKEAVALIGESAYGKSSLAAAFLSKGYSLLSDDLLATRKNKTGFWLQPGTPQIKLMPEPAERFFRGRSGIRMTPTATKKVFTLRPKEYYSKTAEIKTIYVLCPKPKSPPQKKIKIRKLSFREAVVELIRSTHNLVDQNPRRLKKQLAMMSSIAKKIPVRGVVYPYNSRRIPELQGLILNNYLRTR